MTDGRGEQGMNPGQADDPFAYARTHRLMTPDRAAATVSRELAAGDEDVAFRMVLQSRDHLRVAATAIPDGGLPWRTRQRRVADERFDVLYRAVIGHEFPDCPPSWTVGARLQSDWVMADPFRDEPTIRVQTPDWLAAANVFIVERGLITL